ncbi:MAG TPA: ubiquinol-cytochrome c reductase iron-sulfur subunit [Candidatus Dormibacteraeota bacterium]|nr:ubiquinol-cytochrome c reductase iron-sulfur subunit [Candidatus Dormibacteraeota bacterium]
MAHRDPRRLTRRQFDLLGTQVAGAVVAVLLGIPIIGFILSPLFRRQPTYWQQVGDIGSVPDGQPTKFVVSFPQGEWTSSKVNAAVYVVKQNNNYTVLSNVCSHMQCPVHWDDALRQFLCPCHGGLYDITGQNVGGPPPKPLPQYVHRIDGTTLYIENRFTENI